MTIGTGIITSTANPTIEKSVVNGTTIYSLSFEPRALGNWAESHLAFYDAMKVQFNVEIDLTKVRTTRNKNLQLIKLEYHVA